MTKKLPEHFVPNTWQNFAQTICEVMSEEFPGLDWSVSRKGVAFTCRRGVCLFKYAKLNETRGASAKYDLIRDAIVAKMKPPSP